MIGYSAIHALNIKAETIRVLQSVFHSIDIFALHRKHIYNIISLVNMV